MITLQSKRYSLEAYNGTLDSRYPDGDQIGTLYPEEPRYTVDTTYSLPTGNTWTASNTASNSAAGDGATVRDNCGLQYALTNCARNDVIVLTAGATYTGTFDCPSKAGTGWVYVISSALASLPSGTRVVAANVTHMAKIVRTSYAFEMLADSSHWRFCGLEITDDGTAYQGADAIRSTPSTPNDNVPNYIIADRCYFHGSDTYLGGDAFTLGGAYWAVIECRIDRVGKIGADGNDSQEKQGIVSYGYGPYLIENNYIEAAGECIMFGGASALPSVMASDITIRGNHLTVDVALASTVYPKATVKNLLEFKTGQRILVEGNLLSGLWSGQGQSGYALLLTPRNQSGNDPNNYVRDVTIRYNKISECCAGVVLAGGDGDEPWEVQSTQRVSVENNLLVLNGKAATSTPGVLTSVASDIIAFNGPGAGFSDNTDLLPAGNYLIRRNTIVRPSGITEGSGSTVYIGGSAAWKISYVDISDNVFHYGAYGLIGTGVGGTGTTVMNGCSTENRFDNNCWFPISGVSASYPASHQFQSTTAGAAFVDYAGGDYRLDAASPFKAQASDGSDPGCNIDALEAELND